MTDQFKDPILKKEQELEKFLGEIVQIEYEKNKPEKRYPSISIAKVVNDPDYLNALKNPLKYSDIQNIWEIKLGN